MAEDLGGPTVSCEFARWQRGKPRSSHTQTGHQGIRIDMRRPTRFMGRQGREHLRRRMLHASRFPAKMGRIMQCWLLVTPAHSIMWAPKPSDKGFDISVAAASSEEANRRMSTDIPGPRCNEPTKDFTKGGALREVKFAVPLSEYSFLRFNASLGSKRNTLPYSKHLTCANGV